MQKMKERNKKTKDALKLALLNLLMQKNIEEITVKELSELAHVQRATFYRYYKNTTELYDEIKNKDIMEIMNHLMSLQTNKLTITSIRDSLNFIKDKNAFLFIAYKNPDIFADFNNIFKEKCIKSMSEIMNIDLTDKENYHTVCFMFAGVYEYISQWIKSGYANSSENVARHIYVLLNALIDTMPEYSKLSTY